MRLITRADLDGLTCAILLQEVEPIDEVEFAHPKDVQDGKISVSENDVLANLPFDGRAALWFDHHTTQEEAVFDPAMRGAFELSPSAARVVANHYASPKFERYHDLLEAADRLDAALLTREDIVDPQGWILIGYTLDPRSGLGAFKEYFRHLMALAKNHTADEILGDEIVKEHVARLKADEAAFKQHLLATSREDANVVITDVRGLHDLPSGNRFLIYELFPRANVSVRVAEGRTGAFVPIQVGHSILKRDSKTNVGELMAKHGGGGHVGAGTCQPSPDAAEAVLQDIIETLKRNG